MEDADAAPDASGKLIAASMISGTSVHDLVGEKLGSISDVMIDKSSGKTAYAIMSFGGFLGMGTRHHAIPWQRLTFDKRQGVFVVDIDRAELEGAPAYDPEDISAWEDPTYGRQIDNYYGRPRV